MEMAQLFQHIEKFFAVAIVTFVVVGFAVSPKQELQPPNDVWFNDRVINEVAPVLVKFGAEWCGPCRSMDSVLDEYRSKSDGEVRVVQVDIDKHPDLAQHYHVGPIPKLVLFHRGKIVAQTTGSRDYDDLCKWVSSKL